MAYLRSQRSDLVGPGLGENPGLSAPLHCTLQDVVPLFQAQMKSERWDETWPLLILGTVHISVGLLVVKKGSPESYAAKKFYTIYCKYNYTIK